jgi:hypothetical protein
VDPPAASRPEEPGPPRPAGPLDDTERAEYDRLRRARGLRHRRLRICAASLLLVLAVLFAPVTVIATWVNSEVTDTGRYEQTVAPLARDPAVQHLVTDRVTDEVVAKADVRRISDALADFLADRNAPRFLVDAARSLDDQLRSGLAIGVRYAVGRVVTSDAFAEAWDNVNRGAHTAAANLLTGEGGGALEIKGDALTLNVGTVIEEAQKQLIGVTLVGADSIPGAEKPVVLVHNEALGDARTAARWLDTVAPWLPALVIVLAAGGIWAAPARWTALIAAGAGVAVTMCVLIVGLGVARRLTLDAVPPGAEEQDAAAAVYDTMVRFLRQSAVTVLLIALLAVLAGLLYGRSRGAAAVRSAAGRGTGAVGHALARKGLNTGAAGEWLRTHRALTSGVVLGAGVLALLLWNYPTPGAVVLVLVLVLAALAVLGVLAAAVGERRQRP